MGANPLAAEKTHAATRAMLENFIFNGCISLGRHKGRSLKIVIFFRVEMQRSICKFAWVVVVYAIGFDVVVDLRESFVFSHTMEQMTYESKQYVDYFYFSKTETAVRMARGHCFDNTYVIKIQQKIRTHKLHVHAKYFAYFS